MAFPQAAEIAAIRPYIGSYQHALAIEADGALRVRKAVEQANALANEAHVEGYAKGHEAGYNEGWTAAVNQANKNMRQQLAFTRQHFEEKERLKAELARQAQMIYALEAPVMAIEKENQRLRQENGLLRKADSSLRELIGSLRSANERLQQQVKDLDAN